MAIRFKKYKANTNAGEHIVKAIRITEKNVVELTNYICKNGGEAVAKIKISATGDESAYKIRLRQHNYGENWGKLDYRVAKVGDFIVRHDYFEDEYGRKKGDVEFERVKRDDFEATATLVK